MTDVRSLLAERLAAVRGRIAGAARRAGRDPAAVTLVAVTKTVTPAVAAVVFELGAADLGEGRPQELWKKAAALPAARWHLVGHLQRNKLDRTVPLAALIHSVDSERLLAALDDFGRKRGTPVPVLLEVNCSREAAKGGLRPEDLPALADTLPARSGVEVRGLMTMAAYADDPEAARPTFAELRQLRDRLRGVTGLPLPELSMGMSGDFEVGVEEGATLVRVGTTLFEGLPALE
ncbi:YggS family pyridoxal phosphate-dependent enzyme [Urbifossiella limnaea]|uniref:Pyridoxal phosphate homeostasis protein n=1 Tax=Urbifossiella limnaea TaxID=2528023 RepID=A0A517XYT4_9BACT|nr:YggS family pyridoxal phosphate-dependent enzyme [Urbifossiella limnaea]QDU22633.1 Pyridoxal phosphate homeostasis protein [Urbifossiella limnaea]